MISYNLKLGNLIQQSLFLGILTNKLFCFPTCKYNKICTDLTRFRVVMYCWEKQLVVLSTNLRASLKESQCYQQFSF